MSVVGGLPVVPILRRLRQAGYEFQASSCYGNEFQTSLSYVARLRQRNSQKPEAGHVLNNPPFLLAISWPSEQ